MWDKCWAFLKVAGLLMVCVGIPVIGWELWRILPSTANAMPPTPSYAELVTILLTGVTAVLAALAIIVAILAVWGYKSIKEEAAAAADRAVKKTVETAVAKHVADDRIREIVKKEVSKIIGETIAEASEYTEAFPPSENDAKQETIGTEYPKDDGPEG